MFRDDYLIRMIHQLGDFIVKIAGLNQRQEHEAALIEAGKVWGELFDIPRALVDAVDTATLADMLRQPARIRAAAQLFHEEGRALAGMGDPLHAGARYRRALELMLAARAIDPSADAEAAIRELSRLVPSAMLDPRDRTG